MKAEFEFLGGRRLLLSHEDFSYAGKFRLPTKKAVARAPEGDVVAALSYDEDRCRDAARIRYLTVHRDHQRNGIARDLVEFTSEGLLESYPAVRISVNNPYAYESVRRAGFGYTGESGPQDEVVMERPATGASYEEGLKKLLTADTPDTQRRYIERKLGD